MESKTPAQMTTITAPPRSPERRRPLRRAEACLIEIQGAHVGRRTLLDKDEIVIGRAKDVDVPLDEESVSRRHAILRKREQGFLIEDQNSKNGTFVNDRKCPETMLKDQDVIGIGKTFFKFIAGDSPELSYHEELHRLALLDPMLGILNKRCFLEYLDQMHKRARIAGTEFALLLLDIDHFKYVNDTYGHGVGDRVLVEVSQVVKANLRGDDLFGRVGGEEFAILLPQTGVEQARWVAEKLRRAIETLLIIHDNTHIVVTTSLGIALFDPDEAASPRLLLEQADGALYRAKHLGRNRVFLHDPQE